MVESVDVRLVDSVKACEQTKVCICEVIAVFVYRQELVEVMGSAMFMIRQSRLPVWYTNQSLKVVLDLLRVDAGVSSE